MIKPEAMVSHLNKLCFEWDKSGLTLGSNRSCIRQMKSGKTLVSWDSENIVLKDNEFSSLEEYITLLSCSQYTLVLFDGSLIQISYTFDRNGIAGHRLCWYPSPLDISGTQEIDDIIIKLHHIMSDNSNVLEDHITNPQASHPINLKGIYNRSPLRFDFSVMPDDKKDNHPDVHLHISNENCRIPVKTPLCIRMFMQFIIGNFYQNIPLEGSLVNGLPSWESNDMLTAHHKGKIHFNYIR